MDQVDQVDLLLLLLLLLGLPSLPPSLLIPPVEPSVVPLLSSRFSSILLLASCFFLSEMEGAERGDEVVVISVRQLVRTWGRHLVGVVLLVCVVFIWVGGSELMQYVFLEEGFDKPFFLTYCSTSTLSLYLILASLRALCSSLFRRLRLSSSSSSSSSSPPAPAHETRSKERRRGAAQSAEELQGLVSHNGDDDLDDDLDDMDDYKHESGHGHGDDGDDGSDIEISLDAERDHEAINDDDDRGDEIDNIDLSSSNHTSIEGNKGAIPPADHPSGHHHLQKQRRTERTAPGSGLLNDNGDDQNEDISSTPRASTGSSSQHPTRRKRGTRTVGESVPPEVPVTPLSARQVIALLSGYP